MKPLTPSAERVYEADRVFIANTGRSPTYVEIYQGSGVDPSSITNALFRLEQHGKIVRPVKGFIAIPGQKLPDPPIHVKMGYERRTEKQMRPCLSCGNKFDSEASSVTSISGRRWQMSVRYACGSIFKRRQVAVSVNMVAPASPPPSPGFTDCRQTHRSD